MKTEKNPIKVFQKEKITDIKIFIAKWWMKDELLRNKDYTHETSAAVLINQLKLNGCWVPLKNVVSTSKRKKLSIPPRLKKSSHIHVMLQCSTASLQASLWTADGWCWQKIFHLYIT